MASFNNYKHVFTPLKVGTTTLRNRIEFSPMVCNYANVTGEPLDGYVEFVEHQAESGVALIHLGATPVEWEYGADYPAELDVTDELKIPGLRRLSDAAHRFGAKLSVELVHAGRGANPSLLKHGYALAPSNFPIPGQVKYVKEMDEHDIEGVVNAFVNAALNLQKANFDGCLVHGAHGNLIAQFLSPLVNKRTDMYGGSFENRCRFPLRVLKEMREAVGKNFILELRISGDEHVEGGMHIEEVVEFIKLAQEYIDLVTISAGMIVDWRAQFYCMPPYYRPRGANVPYARAVKQCPDIHIPVSVVGGIGSCDMADKIIDEGSADMVAMARALLCDPEMLAKSWRGHPEEVRPCLRCWNCSSGGTGKTIECAMNPSLGQPEHYIHPAPARKKKKVVIIGGGPAGTMAARTLVDRGHDVVLFEKKDKLGGLMPDIDKLPFKTDMLAHTEWLQRTTMACGADIRLNTEATKELVMAENPDAIIVAVGSVPVNPPIPGLDKDKVVSVLDVDSGRKKISGKIVVCGGGVSGCESGLALAMEGNEVTIIDMIPADTFAGGMARITRNMLLYLLKENKVKLIGDHLVREITDKGVRIEGKDWKYQEIEADWVVNCFGIKPNEEAKKPFFELIPEVYYVGDCNEIGTLKTANHSAFFRSCRL